MSLIIAGTALAGVGAGIITVGVSTSSRSCPKWTSKDYLGSGGFGTVWSVVDKKGEKFAVKEIPLKLAQNAKKELRHETEILMRLSHRNIVKFRGSETDEIYFYIYMELMEGSIKDAGLPISNEKAVKYTKDLLQGLIYLHSKNVVHRDIKCANILLDKDGVAKLADFGLSKFHYNTTMLDKGESRAGTLVWMSPETIIGKEAGRRSDVWSVGCTVYEMVKGQPAFYSVCDISKLVNIITNLEHRDLVKRDEDLSQTLQNFLLKIFVKIEKRPYAHGIESHPWLRMFE